MVHETAFMSLDTVQYRVEKQAELLWWTDGFTYGRLSLRWEPLQESLNKTVNLPKHLFSKVSLSEQELDEICSLLCLSFCFWHPIFPPLHFFGLYLLFTPTLRFLYSHWFSHPSPCLKSAPSIHPPSAFFFLFNENHCNSYPPSILGTTHSGTLQVT